MQLSERLLSVSRLLLISEAFMNEAVPTALSGDPLLVWNYASMGVLSFIAGVLFWFTFQELDAREDELNQIPEGGYEKPLNT